MRGDEAAIVGVGHTDFRSRDHRTELRLATEAAVAACADAGIDPSEIDGMCTVSTDDVGENNLAASLGLENVPFFAEVPFGGGGTCATVGLATAAIATGMATTVLCWRSLTGFSGKRFGQPTPMISRFVREFQFLIPVGISTPAQIAALAARRHMYQYGTTWQQFAAVDAGSVGPLCCLRGTPGPR